MKKETQMKGDGFLSFIQSKERKTDIIIFFSLNIVIFVLLSFTYKHLNIFPDSASYIQEAEHFFSLGVRPQGYSGFLYLIHHISSSEELLFLVQFLLNAISSMFLYLVIIYFFRPSSLVISRILLVLIIINPGSLYLTTWILSDSLFVSLTMLWLATGIMIIWKKEAAFKIANLFLLLLLMQTRSAGLFYPIISAAFFYFSISKPLNRIIWVVIPLLLLLLNIELMKYFNYRKTGVKTYSGFAGWVLANNAMHIVPYIDIKIEDIDDEDVSSVHKRIIAQIDSIKFFQQEVTTAYMWFPNYPFRKAYREAKQKYKLNHLEAWNYMSAPLKKYGSYMIRKHPVEFFKYYIIPNSRKIIHPRMGIFSGYYQPGNSLIPIKDWFNYKDDYLNNLAQESDTIINIKSTLIRSWNILLWMLFFVILVYTIIKRFKIISDHKRQLVFITMVAWVISYAIFSIYATPVFIRYLCPVYTAQIILFYIVLNDKARNFKWMLP